LLLTAHYDSVSTAPGATDDGSGVVTLLETLRTLRSGEPVKNDLIFLFAEGEELGLVGAQGFVGEHPWAKEVTVVWSVDSGGSCAPANLYLPNGWMVQEFARALFLIPSPVPSAMNSRN
jgi:Zn-dependent M28 family amino/carboxypeptidase